MCRLLAVRTSSPVPVHEHLLKFAQIAQASKEYQGHGWGISLWQKGHFETYRNVRPIWEDDLAQFGQCDHFIIHARSAFRDEGIVVENNMPFTDDRYSFIFNGELQGVRIKSEGRIGAEKIFNFIKQFDKGDFLLALKRGADIIAARTQRVRAMNIIVSNGRKLFVTCRFSEDPD
jgi:glutamine amidotransferase